MGRSAGGAGSDLYDLRGWSSNRRYRSAASTLEVNDAWQETASGLAKQARAGTDASAGWSRSAGPDRDLHDVAAWLSAFNRNTIQARTSAAFGIAGELPEETWERIGREGALAISDDTRDPLSAIRLTPQMIADRLRVDTNTLRLEAQTLLTEHVHRDYRRLKREREQHLGAVFLDTLTGAARPGDER